MNLDESFELSTSDFDGDWDHIYVRRGTSTHVIITKYKCIENGNLLALDKWNVKTEYNKEWGIKLYRAEKLEKLGI
jgi:hypothetical protein